MHGSMRECISRDQQRADFITTGWAGQFVTILQTTVAATHAYICRHTTTCLQALSGGQCSRRPSCPPVSTPDARGLQVVRPRPCLPAQQHSRATKRHTSHQTMHRPSTRYS